MSEFLSLRILINWSISSRSSLRVNFLHNQIIMPLNLIIGLPSLRLIRSKSASPRGEAGQYNNNFRIIKELIVLID